MKELKLSPQEEQLILEFRKRKSEIIDCYLEAKRRPTLDRFVEDEMQKLFPSIAITRDESSITETIHIRGDDGDPVELCLFRVVIPNLNTDKPATQNYSNTPLFEYKLL